MLVAGDGGGGEGAHVRQLDTRRPGVALWVQSF
jgi:hypothetical protein